MDQIDRLGRRRRPTQSKGLRPLFPPLDPDDESRSLRVAMSKRGWAALERAVDASREPTQPRAVGAVLERALGSSQIPDWQDWQIRKEKQLLGKAS